MGGRQARHTLGTVRSFRARARTTCSGMNGDVAAQSSGESPGKSIDGKGSPGAEAANGVGHDTELSDTDAEGAATKIV